MPVSAVCAQPTGAHARSPWLGRPHYGDTVAVPRHGRIALCPGHLRGGGLRPSERGPRGRHLAQHGMGEPSRSLPILARAAGARGGAVVAEHGGHHCLRVCPRRWHRHHSSPRAHPRQWACAPPALLSLSLSLSLCVCVCARVRRARARSRPHSCPFLLPALSRDSFQRVSPLGARCCGC